MKFALYAIRSAPNRSMGFTPFEIIYGHNMKSPLDIVIQEIEPRTSRNLKAEEWLTELNQSVRLIREQVVKNMESAQKDHMGILVLSTSPWSSLIVPVPKKDGTMYRFSESEQSDRV